jgi:hypothetical protein
MGSAARLDLCQFDSPGALDDTRGLERLVEGGRVADGFQIHEERRIEHESPEWAMTDAGLERAVFAFGGILEPKRRGGKPPNPARRCSVLYQYFRVGMPASQISQHLAVSVTSVKKLIHDCRVGMANVSIQTDKGERKSFHKEVSDYLCRREQDRTRTHSAVVKGAEPADEDSRLKAIESKCRIDESERLWQLELARLGAQLRRRMRSIWRTSDQPYLQIRRMRLNPARKVRRASRLISQGPSKKETEAQPLQAMPTGSLSGRPQNESLHAAA